MNVNTCKLLYLFKVFHSIANITSLDPNERLVGFGLVWFYGTSTIVGYVMLNTFLCIKTVLLKTNQFSIIFEFSSI